MVLHVAVRVPVARRPGVDQLDEPDPTLGEPAGDEALPAEPGRLPAFEAVKGESGGRLARQVEGVGRSLCMPKAVSNERMRASSRGVGGTFGEVSTVGPRDQVELAPSVSPRPR